MATQAYRNMMLRKSSQNHCWPAVRKSVTAIISYTLLLSVIETFIAYRINNAFGLFDGFGVIVCYSVFSLFNSVILRKYVCVISKKNVKDPRFACHWAIFLCSFIFIASGIQMEQTAHLEMHHSKTLSETHFNEDEYYYIDRTETIDTINGKQDIGYHEQHSRHSSPKHDFRGYYIAPFSDRSSVYYAFIYERKYNTDKYSKSESEKIFTQEFQDSVNRVKQAVGNHLFHRISPKEVDYHVLGSLIQYGCSPEKEGYQGIEELLVPVENDRMPRWYDDLPLYAAIYLIFSLLILFFFCISNTEEL